MHCLALFTAFVLVLTSTQTMACQNAACAISDTLVLTECNSIGCVHPTNALENLAKTTERTLSVMRTTEPRATLGLCGPRDCPTEPTVTPLPKNCGRAGCAIPKPKARPATSAGTAESDDGTSTNASALITDAFGAIRAPASTWAERWGLGRPL
jgi:hypothetical protein